VNPKVEHHGSGLEARLRFETLLADLSSRFVNIEPSLVDREIEEAQGPPEVEIDDVASRRGFDLVEDLLQGGEVPESPLETGANGDAR
jgi:hypothetical protein